MIYGITVPGVGKNVGHIFFRVRVVHRDPFSDPFDKMYPHMKFHLNIPHSIPVFHTFVFASTEHQSKNFFLKSRFLYLSVNLFGKTFKIFHVVFELKSFSL